MLKKVGKRVLKSALAVPKVALKASKGVVKHRRKIAGAALLTGIALTALAKAKPSAGLAAVKGLGHGAAGVAKLASMVKR